MQMSSSPFGTGKKSINDRVIPTNLVTMYPRFQALSIFFFSFRFTLGSLCLRCLSLDRGGVPTKRGGKPSRMSVWKFFGHLQKNRAEPTQRSSGRSQSLRPPETLNRGDYQLSPPAPVGLPTIRRNPASPFVSSIEARILGSCREPLRFSSLSRFGG